LLQAGKVTLYSTAKSFSSIKLLQDLEKKRSCCLHLPVCQ